MKINSYFNRVYVINLIDADTRMKKMVKRLGKLGIKYQRFIAVDGRTKNLSNKMIIEKAKSMEITYDVKILGRNNSDIKTDLPAASLTIGTLLLLRHMVKHKIPKILICEDDIEFTRDFEKNFNRGIKELEKTSKKNWDVIYLGCGNKCGNNDISEEKKSGTKYESQLNQFFGGNVHVKNKNDLRRNCHDDCPEISKHISIPESPTGTWCYGYSLKGAKKMLKLVDGDVNNHIDQILSGYIEDKELKAVAFNPPIVMHEYGAYRPDSSIQWEWDK